LLGSETWIVLGAGAISATIAAVIAWLIRKRELEPEDVTIGFLGPSLAAMYLLVLALVADGARHCARGQHCARGRLRRTYLIRRHRPGRSPSRRWSRARLRLAVPGFSGILAVPGKRRLAALPRSSPSGGGTVPDAAAPPVTVTVRERVLPRSASKLIAPPPSLPARGLPKGLLIALIIAPCVAAAVTRFARGR
jgi:hypothetical protein